MKKSKIRTRIFAIFIVPFGTACLFIIIVFILFNTVMSNEWHLQSDERFTCEFMEVIEEQYDEIRNKDRFMKIMNPYLNKTNSQLKVVDRNGEILFQSEDDLNLYGIIPSGKRKENKNLYIVSNPIERNGKIVAIAYIIKNKSNITKMKYQNVLIVIIYILGVAIMICLMLLYLKRFTSKFLRTIEELKHAAEEIAIGRFDVEVKSYSDDELSEFCVYFNQMKDRLNQSLREKERYEENRKEMIAAISHDLRTPLTTIQTYVEGLQCHMADSPEKFDKYLEIIQNKVRRLDRLIEDLFMYSQCQVGKFAINKKVYSMLQLFHEIQLEYECKDINKEILFQIVGNIEQEQVSVDKDRIKQVIDNLITNATHYSKGKVQIKVGVKQSENDIVIFIRDNGIGIAEEELPLIFEHFYRCEKSRLSNHGGMGLGLAICQYIVEAHGGTISVESKRNEGSTFYIRIPTC